MKEPLVLKYPDPLPPLTRGITNSVPPRANSPQAHDSNGIEPFSPAFVQTSSYSTTAQMIPNNRLLLQSFWTQTLQRRQRNSNGALHVSAIDNYGAEWQGGKQTHPCRQRLHLSQRAPRRFPKQAEIKGKCHIKIYESLVLGADNLW